MGYEAQKENKMARKIVTVGRYGQKIGLKDPMGFGWEKQGHPDSCGADAANEPEEELTELEGDTLWSQD
jgi:hypothetical protein